MSKVIVDSIQPSTGDTLDIQGDVILTGSLNGVPVTVLTGNTTFTGNTSGNCTSKMYVDYLYGCDGQLNIGTNAIVDNKLTANYFYGDGSNLTNLSIPVFTGNTSGECIQDLWVQYLEGCDGSVTIKDNLNVSGTLNGVTFYGDSSNLRLSINNLNCPKCSTITPTISYMNYGLNVVTSANTTDHCVRLPQTPIIGQTATLVNNSGFDIFVFPSVGQSLPNTFGGSINGKTNGSYKTASLIIPSDSNSYSFYCYDDQDGGKWSSSVIQSLNQYDSGVISVNTSNGESIISAINDNYKNYTDGFNLYTVAYNSLTQPNILYNPSPATTCNPAISGQCAVVWFKPTTPWTRINKITVFTNFSTALTSSGYYEICYATERSYYSAGTVSPLGLRGWTGVGDLGGTYGAVDQMLAGNSSTNFTNNPGDPGTWWGEINYSPLQGQLPFGDVLLSSGTMTLGIPVNNTVNADLYSSTYWGFIFETAQISTNVKFRFLIDYTI